MAGQIPARELRTLLADPLRTAFLDVRETAEYNLAHIPGFCSLPRRRIEYELLTLVPCASTRVILCDDDGQRAALAASTLERMGYSAVSVLAGGINRWVSEGGETEWGVNVPSKDFGEKVVLQQGVRELEADQLHEWLQRGEPVVILDARTPEEHQRSCIPGSRSLPGAELALRIGELVQDADTPIVVHCAGRTRSIIGARTLQRMGLRNVYALKNGTMGWQLAGLDLETGSDRLQLPTVSAEQRRAAEQKARAIAAEDGVRLLDLAGLEALRRRAAEENLYLVDVRSREEYFAGHIPGFRWVPGGQLVQATDSFLAVRGGTIVLACDGIVRAAMTGSWLRQMGYPEVYILEGGTSAWSKAGNSLEEGEQPAQPWGFQQAYHSVGRVRPLDLWRELQQADPAPVLFVGTSAEFSQGHAPGARWLSRGWLEPRIAEFASPSQRLVVTCADGIESVLAAATLKALGYAGVRVLEGGMSSWRAAGLPLETGLTGVTQTPDDVLPARRSFAEMMNYLRWEEQLGHKYRPT